MPAFKILLSSALSFAAYTALPENQDIPNKPREILHTIRSENPSLMITWNPVTQTPDMLAGALTKPSLHSPGWIAYTYLDRVKGLYDLKNAREDLRTVEIRKLDSAVVLRMQRLLFHKPVCGDELLVEVDHSGVIRRIEGNLHSGLSKKRLGRPMYPAVSTSEARDIAKAFDDSVGNSPSIRVESCYRPDREGVPLVYTILYKKEGLPASVHVHALTGKVIE